MPCPSHSPWLDNFNYIWRRVTGYEALHYAVFSNLLSLHPSSVQIFPSAPCSQTPSVYVPPLMSEIKFHTHMKPQGKLQFCILSIHYIYTKSLCMFTPELAGGRAGKGHGQTPYACIITAVSSWCGIYNNFIMLCEIIVRDYADRTLLALVARSTNSAGRWIWQQYSFCRQLSSFLVNMPI
jgi:hypothetical protein